MEKKLIYENPLANPEDIKDFILEGQAKIDFVDGHMRMENAISQEAGQKANYVLWCDREFPDDVTITWDFKPIKEPGLAMLFFAAKAKDGGSIFADKLEKRDGQYTQYHHGDINAFHVSYFRRKEPDERAFHTCNLRKSYGFYLVTQGADPIPDASPDLDWYHIKVVKKPTEVDFFINDLKLFHFDDTNSEYGAPLSGGHIGFRQLAPMIGDYANLRVYEN